jgi:pyruvate/2-oxoglutarate dehydrogenase complex dihydrolipoamide acyltransferase (E2) component
MLEIRTPELPDGASAKVVRVRFAVGERVEKGDCLFEIETQKVILDVIAPEDGEMHENIVKKGDIVKSEQIICLINDDKDTYYEDVEHLQAQLKKHKKSSVKSAKVSADKNSSKSDTDNSDGASQTAFVIICVLIVFACILVFL